MDKATIDFLTDLKKEIKSDFKELGEKFSEIDKLMAVHLEYCGNRCSSTDMKLERIVVDIEKINKKPAFIWNEIRMWGALAAAIVAIVWKKQ